MHPLAYLSLAVNVAVLAPVTLGLITGADWANEAYGPRQDGRQILLAMYLAIGALSIALLVWRRPDVVLGLLLAQIVYKLLTPLTVGAVAHPVVLSNLAIAALHSVTVVALLRSDG